MPSSPRSVTCLLFFQIETLESRNSVIVTELESIKKCYEELLSNVDQGQSVSECGKPRSQSMSTAMCARITAELKKISQVLNEAAKVEKHSRICSSSKK